MESDATGRRGVSLASVLGFAVIVALLAALTWAIVRDDNAGRATTTAAETSTGAGCESPVAVEVTTTADFAPVVEAAVDRVEELEQCARYAVTTASSAIAADQIRAGGDLPDVWIPDSEVWLEQVTQDPDAPAVTTGPILATSPVALAVPSALAESAGVSGPQPWQAILAGPLQVRMGDPEESTTSLLLLHSASQALGATPQGEQLLGAAVIQMSRQPVSEEELFAQASADGQDATAVAASEQQIYRQRAENPERAMEAVVPAEGAGALSYPWVSLAGADQDAETQRAVSALEEALTGADGVANRQQAGFRVPGEAPPEVPGFAADTAADATAPSAAEADAVVTLWNTVAVDMRMIAVIDVSGSMLQPVDNRTRIELAAASAQAAMQVFPPTSQVGLWVFSTNHPSGNDWTELAPIAQLDSQIGGERTHRDALLAATATLPSYAVPEGDTGLYDTVLAAYQEVQGSYEPGYVNSVVLLTDGVNEDDNSISLSDLLARLQAMVDPSRPVPIITVGMGEGADEEVLRLISAQTGGRSYLARDPAEIGTVFVDALTHRSRTG